MGPLGNNKGKRTIVAEINVTPLVDVMLVLLIIFMVTAPMMTQGLEVELPGQPPKPCVSKKSPWWSRSKKEGDVYLKKEKVTSATLQQQLQSMPPEVKKRRHLSPSG